MQSQIAGRVHLDGTPRAGVDVALVDAGDRPLATAVTDATGRFELAAPTGFAKGWVLARVKEPFLGVVAAAAEVDKPIALELSSRPAVTMTVKIVLPSGLPFDLGDLDLDPEALPGVPANVLRAAGAVGGDDERRKTFRRVHLAKPEARVRLLPGTWLVEAHREVDGPTPPPFDDGPRNWESRTARVGTGKPIQRQLGGHRIEVKRDSTLTLRCEPSRG